MPTLGGAAGPTLPVAALNPLGALVLVVGLAGGAVLVIALAVTARRLLGLTVGPVRTFVAGAIGYVAASLIAAASGASSNAALLPLLIGISVLVAMALLVAGEAVAPSGVRTRPLRAVRQRVRRARRYSQVTRIAVRHGLGPYLRGQRGWRGATPRARAERARSVRLALAEGGVTFVKLGQLLSTRRDLLAPELADELARLQHQAQPAPWDAVRALLTEELGAPPEQVFAEIETEPLAAASVAQVHLARLRSGEEVVVKVQRPGIGPVVQRDLDILVSLAGLVETRARRGTSALQTVAGPPAGINALDLAHGFAGALAEELDFRVEARNIAAVRAAAAGRDGDVEVHLPAVHAELSSARVLVLERLRGVPLGVAADVIDARGRDRMRLGRSLVHCFLDQMMLGGTFHADPHPGNILLLDDGRLGLLDFGSVGRLDAQLRDALGQLLLGIDRGDAAAATDALLALARRPDELDERRLERDLGRFIGRHLGGGGDRLGAAAFTDLFALLSRHGLIIAPDVAAVFRAFATLEGTLAQLAPELDLVGETRRFATAHVTGRASASASTAADELVALLPILRRLPRRVDRIAGALEEGRLGLGVRLFADARDRRVVTNLLHQALIAFLAASTGVMGTLLLGDGGGPRVSSSLRLFALLGYCLLVVSFVLMLRVLVILFRPET